MAKLMRKVEQIQQQVTLVERRSAIEYGHSSPSRRRIEEKLDEISKKIDTKGQGEQ